MVAVYVTTRLHFFVRALNRQKQESAIYEGELESLCPYFFSEITV